MQIFYEFELSDYFRQRTLAIQEEVHNENRDKLLNVNETQYVDYLVNRYRLEPLVFHWDKVFARDHEEMVPAARYPEGTAYPRQVITYHLPYSGDNDLLRCRPSTRILWTEEIQMRNGILLFDIINWRNDPAEVKRSADEVLNHIKHQAENVARDVAQYNQNLEGSVRQTVQGRKTVHLKQLNLLQALGVPIAQTGNIPQTFAIPVQKKQVIVKPQAPSTAYKPEPTIDDSIYTSILKIIHENGIEMERHPEFYSGKDEETLRDHFLLILAPHFQSVTGETFNKSGKTDILIRHEKQNVFVAECKFWKGTKGFQDTIDQLLGYLTWRDSKAAILCFVQNKELNPVFQQIEQEAPRHSCFVKAFGKQGEGWFNFEFHLKDDATRSVRMAVLCFHMPKAGK